VAQRVDCDSIDGLSHANEISREQTSPSPVLMDRPSIENVCQEIRTYTRQGKIDDEIGAWNYKHKTEPFPPQR